MKRSVLMAVALMVLNLAVLQIASAHAEVDKCTPSDGATVASAPAQVVCVMTEEIDPKRSALVVLDASGAQVDKNDSKVDLNDPNRKTLVVSLDPAKIKNGVFTVKWNAVTPDDNGASNGSFKFTIGVAAPVGQATAAVAATPLITPTVAVTRTVAAPAAPTTLPTSTAAPAATPATLPATGASIDGNLYLTALGGLLALGALVLGFATRRRPR